MPHSILYNGVEHPTDYAVDRDIDYYWRAGDPGTRKRTQDIRAIVLHHTAGEGAGPQICRTLRARKLSVHFTVDSSGRIMQHADLDTVTFHAGIANGWSVGIEASNLGIPPHSPKMYRTTYVDYAHGVKRGFLKFTPEQVGALSSLCSSLTQILHLPFTFPTDDNGRVVRGVLSAEALSSWRGLLGHMHFNPKKIDPSPHIFEELVQK